ncbi:MAG TPA: NnrU family protein [Rhodobacteraceae bacterium]|nr:NnrU family protein [Paracoccaceae bacterium]
MVFFASHRLPVMPRVKARLVGVLGGWGFTAAYSAMSAGLLSWIIVAAGRAPYVELWPHQGWMNLVTLALMAVASVIFALALGRPNPLSFGGMHSERFDPDRPGLIGWMRHPLLVVLGLWSAAHILPNGDLAHVIMFGLFLGFSFMGMKIIDRRKRRLLGEADWARLAATRRELRITTPGIARVLAGLALFALLLTLHPGVIGVDPLAF